MRSAIMVGSVPSHNLGQGNYYSSHAGRNHYVVAAKCLVFFEIISNMVTQQQLRMCEAAVVLFYIF